MADNTFRILKGPSRESLFDSLRLWNEHRKIEFFVVKKLNHMTMVQATINSIAVESGDGNNWFGTGNTTTGEKFQYYFNTTRRDGSVTFPDR